MVDCWIPFWKFDSPQSILSTLECMRLRYESNCYWDESVNMRYTTKQLELMNPNYVKLRWRYGEIVSMPKHQCGYHLFTLSFRYHVPSYRDRTCSNLDSNGWGASDFPNEIVQPTILHVHTSFSITFRLFVRQNANKRYNRTWCYLCVCVCVRARKQTSIEWMELSDRVSSHVKITTENQAKNHCRRITSDKLRNRTYCCKKTIRK